MPIPPSGQAQGLPDDEAQEPGPERTSRVEPMTVFPGAQEGVLHRVLGVHAIPQDQIGGAKRPQLICPDQHLQSLRIAPLPPLNGLGLIHPPIPPERVVRSSVQ
jgi:hypothetical protein